MFLARCGIRGDLPRGTRTLLQRAPWTSSATCKGKRAVPSPKSIAREVSFRESSKPQWPAFNRVQPQASPQDHEKPKTGYLRKYGRRMLYYWAAGGAIWFVYITASYIQYREHVPITGRERYKGLPAFNRAFDQGLAEGKQRFEAELRSNSSPQVVDGTVVIGRVGAILNRIIRSAGLEGHAFKILHVSGFGQPQAAINAAGEIYINEAMLQAARSDSQLPFVLAHKVGHCLASHPREGAKIDNYLSRLAIPLWPVIIPGAAALGAASFLGGGLLVFAPELLVVLVPAAILTSLVAMAFIYSRYTSRQRELEADTIGLCLMDAAGYDLDAAPYIMNSLGDFEQRPVAALRAQNPGATIGSSHETHPPNNDRIKRLRSTIPFVRAARGRYDPCAIGDDNLDKRDTESQKQLIDRWTEFKRQRDEKRLCSQPVTE